MLRLKNFSLLNNYLLRLKCWINCSILGRLGRITTRLYIVAGSCSAALAAPYLIMQHHNNNIWAATRANFLIMRVLPWEVLARLYSFCAVAISSPRQIPSPLSPAICPICVYSPGNYLLFFINGKCDCKYEKQKRFLVFSTHFICFLGLRLYAVSW